VSIGDLWPDINSIEGVAGEVASMTAASSHLEASTSRPLSGVGSTVKGKTVVGFEKCMQR
jgi:hypothetical protein